MKRFNNYIANQLAKSMATMWMFWIVAMLCMIAYALQRPIGAQGQVLFWVSIFFQGVALPVLALVSNQQGDKTNALLQETHDAVMGELESARNVQTILLDELADMKIRHTMQEQILAEVKAIHKEMGTSRE